MVSLSFRLKKFLADNVLMQAGMYFVWKLSWRQW